MIPLREQELLKQRFARELQNRVRIDFFGQKPASVYIPGRVDRSAACKDVSRLLRELAALNLRISLTEHDIDEDPATAEALGVQAVPAIVLRGPNNRPVRYYGNPRMKQFLAFVETLVLVANGKANLQAETLRTLRKVRSDVSLKVFTMPPCAHSPAAVITALRLALESSHVKLDLFDVATFPEMIGPFNVQATPITAIDDQYIVPGVIDEASLADDVLTRAQGGEPAKGGDPKRLTPMPRPQPQQAQQQQRAPRTTPGGLIIPR
jgi:alkyl hydroperoxide reductase subunit AhpF